MGKDLFEHMAEMTNGRLGDSMLYFDSSSPNARGDYSYISEWLFLPRFDDDVFYRLVPQGRDLRPHVLNTRFVYSGASRQIFLIGGNPPAENEAQKLH